MNRPAPPSVGAGSSLVPIPPAEVPPSEAVTADPIRDLMDKSRGQDGGLALVVARELTLYKLGLGPPPEVGRYLLERKLGEGGMGTVFLAFDPHLERPLAVKIVNPHMDEPASDVLAREARALARLNDPHVLTVHDVGGRAGQLWLAMEYLEGGTLRQWREEHPEADWREVVRRYLGAARGLAAAHRAGFVHRDFKPDNAMIGADGRVRVADFGLAVLVERTGERDGVVAGTPFYMAPEARRGAEVGPAADQYSFFVALAEALDPHRPNAPVSAGQIIARLATPAPVADIAPQPQAQSPSARVPRALATVIARGLAEAPHQRHATLDDVVRELEHLVVSPNEDPRRHVLLDRVETLWLGGVLDAALAGRAAASLPLEPVLDLIDSPWATIAEAPSSGRVEMTPSSLREALARSHGSLLLVGAPGAGKTTALLLLARALSARARAEPGEPLPVVLNLASLSSYEGTFDRWLIDELVVKYGLPRGRAREWLDRDQLVLLLDGLDEVALHRRSVVASAIDAFRANHPVTTVVACREDNYAALGYKLRFAYALRLAPLDPQSLLTLCASLGPEGELAKKALALQVETATPLVVSLLARASAPRRGEVKPLAVSDADVWGQVVARALDRPPPLQDAARARLVGVLSWLAHTLTRQGMSDVWLERIDPGWLERPGQRLAARAVGVLFIVVTLFLGNLAAAVIADRPPLIGALLGLASLPVVLLFNRGLDIKPGVRLVWSWRVSLRRLPILLVLAVLLGAMVGAFLIPWVNIVLALSMAIAMAPMVGLVPQDREEVLRPGQGIWRAAQTGLIVFPITALMCGLAAGYVAVPAVLPHVGPESHLLRMADPSASLFWTTGLFSGLCVAFVYGWTSVALYLALRLVMWLCGAPLLLARSLDLAVDRGLLRRVGGGWMFLHRTLLDYFARPR